MNVYQMQERLVGKWRGYWHIAMKPEHFSAFLDHYRETCRYSDEQWARVRFVRADVHPYDTDRRFEGGEVIYARR